MSLKERVYSVLVVSASAKFNQALPEFFPVSTFSPVSTVNDVSTAKRAVSERDFDFIIINSPLPDDAGLRFAVDAVSSYQTVVLFLAPLSRAMFQLAAGWLVSARERIRKTEKKTLSIEEKMAEIRLVNRAKWLLISEVKMTEPDAHRYIEKQAMDRCLPRRQVAEEIIKTYG